MRGYRNRFLIACFILIQGFLILGLRLGYLQILRGEEFERFSLENRVRSYRLMAQRGRILDRHGRELALDRPSFDVYVEKDSAGEVREARRETVSPELDAGSEQAHSNDDHSPYELLGKALFVEPVSVKEKITNSVAKDPFKPTLVAQDISRDQLAFIEARRISLPGVIIKVNQIREYPYGKMASHLLGYVGKISKEEFKKKRGYNQDDVLGKSGVEGAWEDYLKGKDGFAQEVTDALGRRVKRSFFEEDLKSRASVPGNDTVLSVDLDIQRAAEEALGEKRGAVVVMDVRTGEVRALVSHPSFDPRDFVMGIDGEKWSALMSDPFSSLTNRATQGLYPPGSVFKIITAAAGLEEGVIGTGTWFSCHGGYRLGRRTFRCWRKGGHGLLALHEAIVESCDVYFYNVADRLGIDRLSFYMKAFGLGNSTGIEIPENPGIAPSKEWKKERLGKEWYRGETVISGIGQGFILTTPLQVAVATAAVANGGILLKPQIVKEVISPQGEVVVRYSPEEKGHLPTRPETLEIIRRAMTGVVNGGTGRAAGLENMTVAGKTGTAQAISQNLKNAPEEYKDHAWFTSFAPAENPEIVVTVLVENGGKGGAVAAPIAKKVLEVYAELRKNKGSS